MNTQSDPTTTRRRLQPIIFRMVNVPMRALLSLPVRTPLSERLMLVYFTGRKTGKRYRQPVSYVRDSGTLLTPAAAAGPATCATASRSGCGSAAGT